MSARSRRRLDWVRRVAITIGLVLAAGTGDAAPRASSPPRKARSVQVARRSLAVPKAAVKRTGSEAAWASLLPAIEVKNVKTRARAKIRLYAPDGSVDAAALQRFMHLASAETEEAGAAPETLDPRLVQLAFRAAYRFGGAPMVIVSATRKGARGKHGTGDAIDFKLEGVRAAKLAAYARSFPRAGVGVYTHPKTQFIHLDVRDQSYHWLDASPPGVTWRERRLKDPAQQKRDARYAPRLDLPEVASR